VLLGRLVRRKETQGHKQGQRMGCEIGHARRSPELEKLHQVHTFQQGFCLIPDDIHEIAVIAKLVEEGSQNSALGILISFKHPTIEVDDGKILILIEFALKYLENA